MAEVMVQPAELAQMSPMTPITPTTSNSMGPMTTSSSRRTSRKSTLTQQQKNHKRQRATQDQLATLEVEFNNNPTPTAVVRDRIAQDINMTERSVQIWFQNRRAKIKTLAKKSIETGEDCDAIPASMRKYLALQASESGRPVPDAFNGPMNGFSNGLFMMNPESNASKVAIQHFNCSSLSIGSWRRVGQAALDLVVFYAPEKSWVTYYINADAHGFRIEYPFSYIKNITLDSGDASSNAEGAQRSGGLVVELNRPPHFSMDPGSGGFFQCRDFTEDHQASNVLVHHLGGHPKVLSGQLAKLVSLDSFRNRHRMFDGTPPAAEQPVPPAVLQAPPPPPPPAMMTPISPPEHRPASQPNHFVHPRMASVQESRLGMPMQPGRGHKRQRSRSVPVAIDFSQFQRPFAPFFPSHAMQQQHPQPHTPIEMPTTPHIFAPIPQHATMAPQAHAMNPFQPTLGVVESPPPDYGFDFPQGPMSATTANSPSEFEPTFFTTSGPPSENFMAPPLNTAYSMPLLSPGIDPSTVQPSISPLSALSHGDPIIANSSPPLTTLDRSASADIYPVSQDNTGFADDAFTFDEIYGKQHFTLPFRSPLMDDPNDEYDFHSQFINFGTIDPSALSPNAPTNSTFQTPSS